MRWHPAAEAILGGCQLWKAFWASQVKTVVKNPPASAGAVRDRGSIPGWGSSSGGGHGNPLQYSCLENLMDRGAWQATIHRLTKSQTWLKQLSRHACQGLSSGSTPSSWKAKSFIFKGGCGLHIMASTHHASTLPDLPTKVKPGQQYRTVSKPWQRKTEKTSHWKRPFLV